MAWKAADRDDQTAVRVKILCDYRLKYVINQRSSRMSIVEIA